MKNSTLSLETLQEIVKTSVDAIIVINQKGIIEYVNLATLLLFLYQEHELIGQNIALLMPEPNKSAHDSYLKNYKTTQQKKIIGIGREVVAQKKNGELFHCRLAISEAEKDGEILYTGIIHDISALKQAEENLIDLNKSLENKVQERTEKLSDVVNRLLTTNKELSKEVSLRKKAEKALKENEQELKKLLDKEMELSELKSRFVTLASHEFRTPLSTILSSTNLIEKYIPLNNTAKIDKHIFKIKSSIQHLNTILQDFLLLGKLDEGKIQIEKSSFNLNDLIHDIIEGFQDILKDGQIIQFENNAEITITSDKKLLKNAIINLISNASKYSNEGKAISINLQLQKDVVEITVKDNGVGIPEKELAKVFDRFYRASNVTNIDGTGIGLNLVKSYLEKIKGTIKVESTLNIGTTFTMKFPTNEE